MEKSSFFGMLDQTNTKNLNFNVWRPYCEIWWPSKGFENPSLRTTALGGHS
jgi:hypothetical protein